MDARQAIAANPFFSEVLREEEIAALSRRALAVSHQAGTELIREDDSDTSLFIILAGTVEVLAGDTRHGRPVATLGPGDFFGEMSLLTGERRSTTVRAKSDVSVLEITSLAIGPFLDASPELVDRFASVLEQRQTQLDRAYGAGSFAMLDRGGFAALIRGFFGGRL